ncbi:TRAP transporter substrate-binding protein [Psychrobacter alimentarius]|uniref:TRAP transporter substrate-binding protein n=1 Tax=Psychrobacter alimentarius TaxID=261164 RepID=UPI001917F888|nr:TRAP transporter substrate-binding protein [Psychrobacter alimentarius]
MKLTSFFALSILTTVGLLGCSNQANDTADSASDTSQKTTTLRFSYYWPATSNMNTDVFEPWAKKIEADSNGRLKIELYPSAVLSEPGVTYDATVKGIVDIGSQAHGFTSGRFPLTQIAELPGISNSATQMGCIVQTLYDNGAIASEYEDSHLLFAYGAGPGALHTTNTPIRKPEDMKGLRMRHPSVVAASLMESMGASPIGLPSNDIYTSLQRGVIDGLSLPWGAVETFKIDELVKYHTNISFYSSAALVTMNKQKYESLPDDLKKVIDDNSGMAMAKKAGEVLDKEDKVAMQHAKDLGQEVIDIPDPLNNPAWRGILLKGTQQYLDDVTALGHDAQAVYKETQAASAACKV